MGCTCETWVKGVDNFQDFKRFVRNLNMCINHRIFVCTMFVSCCLRTCIPCRWYDTLIVCRTTIFNMNPVTQTAARCIYKTNAFSILRPFIWLKFRCIRNSSITIFDVSYEFIKEVLTNIRSHLCIKATTCGTANHCRHPYMSRHTQYLGYSIDLTNHHGFSPSWISDNALFYLCIYNDIFS